MLHSSLLRLLVIASAICLMPQCTIFPRTSESKGDIHQVGLVWLKNAGNKDDQDKVIQAVQAFGREIPGVKSAVVGRTDGIGGPMSDTSYDLCFVITFKDEAARQNYNTHPVHQKAAKDVFLPLSQKILFYRFVGE